jgi:hypothetical protein
LLKIARRFFKAAAIPEKPARFLTAKKRGNQVPNKVIPKLCFFVVNSQRYVKEPIYALVLRSGTAEGGKAMVDGPTCAKEILATDGHRLNTDALPHGLSPSIVAQANRWTQIKHRCPSPRGEEKVFNRL